MKIKCVQLFHFLPLLVDCEVTILISLSLTRQSVMLPWSAPPPVPPHLFYFSALGEVPRREQDCFDST
jgi:hypothetical protein